MPIVYQVQEAKNRILVLMAEGDPLSRDRFNMALCELVDLCIRAGIELGRNQ